jgi:CheY-like chemotaxis protein
VQDQETLRILVIEDNRDAADGLAKLLEHLGFKSLACYTGRESLERLDDFGPQVVLLGLGMPDMDGFEIARTIRERYGPRQPVLVACTGYSRAADRDRTAQAGFTLHVLKPVLTDELKATIEHARSLLFNSDGD